MNTHNYSKLLTSLLLLLQRVFVLLWLAAGIGTAIAFCQAINTLIYSSDERAQASICQLPEQVLYYYFWIKDAYRMGEIEYGEDVARFWLETRYYHVPEDQALFLERTPYSYAKKVNEIIKQAAAVNFHLSESLPFTDKGVLLEIKHTKDSCADSIRRTDFRERFDDFLRLFGLASLFCLAAVTLCGLTNKINNARERTDRRNSQ